MISQEVKDKIKPLIGKTVWHFNEIIEEGKLSSSLRFTEDTDLEFELIDFYYSGVLSMIIEDAKERAERFNFDEGYERAKTYLSFFVGWDTLISKDLQPALHTSKAYDVVLEKLANACWTGHNKGRKKHKQCISNK